MESFVITDFARVGCTSITNPSATSSTLLRNGEHPFSNKYSATAKAILQTIQWLNPKEYTMLNSITGIGKVYSTGILAEFGYIKAFENVNALAKYCGIVWNDIDSGDFEAKDKRMSKADNCYMRYYIEAAGNVINHCPKYKSFYEKKYAETRTHQHKRALALTSRKFIRLPFGLLGKNQLYSPKKSRQSIALNISFFNPIPPK